MQLETLLSAKVDDKLEFFPEFKVSLQNEGIQVYARSPLFAELFAKYPMKPGDEFFIRQWRGNNLRVFSKMHPFASYIHLEYGMWLGGGGGDGSRSVPNLLFLTHPDLASGCTVLIKEPMALNDVEDYFTSACGALREIYVQHIRSVEFSAKLREVFRG